MRVAVIGGTGTQGSALAARFARAGVAVIIGSRDAARAESAAAQLAQRAQAGFDDVRGMSNRDAASNADIIVLSVPYAGTQAILEDIREAAQHKIVMNIASSLDPERKSRARVPTAGSITAEVQAFLGESVKVVAAFQNIAPQKLEPPTAAIDSDVLVCGADRETRRTIIELIQRMGLNAVDAGVLANAVAVETLTAVLIAINLRYKITGAGIRITGLPAAG
ncbi:MAG: NADPH-dependent F420 reductase [Chloroflexi bacterium]|nr:NADPH-dependent F420 reductase [Chloroflexota bacterium]